jgi:hypothetical protein
MRRLTFFLAATSSSFVARRRMDMYSAKMRYSSRRKSSFSSWGVLGVKRLAAAESTARQRVLAMALTVADQALLGDEDLPGEQKVQPRVGITLADDGLAVLVFPDFAELEQPAKALGLEVPQGGNRHQLLDVLDVVLEIFRFDHKTPLTLVGTGFGGDP